MIGAFAHGVIITACTGSFELISPAEDTPEDTVATDTVRTDTTADTSGGDVQHAGLVVSASVASSPDALAALQDLGMSDSALVEAAVQVQRDRSSEIHAATTDSGGQAFFTDLLTGSYDLSVLRLLSPSERALLRPSLADVTGFAGGRRVTVTAPETATGVITVMGRRGSLVISEVWDHAPLLAADNAYASGMYLELYNNADTTVYLDHKLVGWGPIWGWRGNTACEETAAWQLDPEGLWSPMLMRLPGSGGQYPLRPGEAAVIAVDAIDHSSVDPRLPDLSGATFETVGPTDVDNPEVPNAEIIVQEFEFFGRGILLIGGLSNIYFVADEVDLSTVTRARPDIGSQDELWVRVPRERILDVYSSKATTNITATLGGDDFCERMILDAFDTQPGRFFDGHGFYSIVRRSLGVFNGRAMLQRTKTSSRDFERSEVLTPSRIP